MGPFWGSGRVVKVFSLEASLALVAKHFDNFHAFLGVLASLHCWCRCLKGYLLGFRSGKGALFRKWHPLKEKAFRSFREELRGAGPHLVLCTSPLQTLESDHFGVLAVREVTSF